MAIFFLLVGLEIKFEMTAGELKNPRKALLPILGAAGGAIVPNNASIVLYLGVEKPNAPSTVPNVVGKTPAEANKALTNAGLIMKVTGATSTGGSTGSVTAISQSAEAGTELAAGSVVTVRFGAKTTD